MASPKTRREANGDMRKNRKRSTKSRGTGAAAFAETVAAGAGKRRRRAAAAIKRHRVTKCPMTGKRRYRDSKQAKDALRSVRERRQLDVQHGRETRRLEVRDYRCPVCLGRHLTHLPSWIERITP
jgi:hypothetical protein